MTVTIVSDLISEPVSLTEAKQWMRIKEFTDDDTMILELIKSTRLHLEKFTGLSFGTKTLKTTLTLDNVWEEIPYSPVNSITLVERYGSDGTFEAYTDYQSFESKIKVGVGGIYRITYQSGFMSLPEDLKTDIKVLVAWQYENRGLHFKNNTGESTGVDMYPHWNLLNSRHYRKVVI